MISITYTPIYNYSLTNIFNIINVNVTTFNSMC